jgi:23S rRNA pseudouridine1911/1915/1917 synthase
LYERKQKNKTIRFKAKENAELFVLLQEYFPGKSRTNIKKILTNELITINNRTITRFNHLVNKDDEIVINSVNLIKAANFKGFKIIHEDEAIVVINKESGLLTIAPVSENEITAFGQLINYIKTNDSQEKIFIVHRLDKYTSGVMLFAKGEKNRDYFRNDWHEVVKERQYIGIVEGIPKESEGKIVSYLKETKTQLVYSTKDTDGKLAITHFKVLRSSKKFSLLEFHLETGRKNQIRVHMKDIGHSIVGDKKYGATHNPYDRLMLHAETLAFIHPGTNELISFSTRPPKIFTEFFS